MPDFAIIVAGGTGQRMNHALPKQFHVLGSIPVLMRTLHAFHRTSTKPEIVLVLATDWIDYWTDLCYQYQFHVPHLIVEGGATRFQSVRNGLAFIESERLTEPSLRKVAAIAIHDGARPLVTPDLIDRTFETARKCGTAAPGVGSPDSLRLTDPENSTNTALDRNRVRMMQTPQTFQAELILEAYRQKEKPEFTDDCSVVEAKGIPVTILEGDLANLKITTADDLAIARAYLQE